MRRLIVNITTAATIALSLIIAVSTDAQPNAPAPVVNVNTATPAQLMMLPGVGGNTAASIIATRPFKMPADLMRVRGIKGKRFAKMAPFVTVSGPTTVVGKIRVAKVGGGK